MGYLLGSISGYVSDTKLNHLSSVSIRITGVKTTSEKTIKSDETGYFMFEDVEPDTYTIVSKKKGYKSDKMTIKLEAGETKEIEITLKIKKGNRRLQ